jgi:hypothetical protein
VLAPPALLVLTVEVLAPPVLLVLPVVEAPTLVAGAPPVPTLELTPDVDAPPVSPGVPESTDDTHASPVRERPAAKTVQSAALPRAGFAMGL